MNLRHFDHLAYRFFVGPVEKSVGRSIDKELDSLSKQNLLEKVRKQARNVSNALREAAVPGEMPADLWVGGDIVVIEEPVDESRSFVSVNFVPLPGEVVRNTFTHLSWIRKFPTGRVEAYQVPMFMVLLSESKRYCQRGLYQVYRHSFSPKLHNVIDQKSELGEAQANLDMATYVGITKRGWQVRYNQHLRDAQSGSPYLFHDALRNGSNFNLVEHEVYAAGLSYDQAMDVEEHWVEEMSLYPKGLNMIPGGHAGLRYLAKMNALRPGETGEERDRAISDAMRGRPRGSTAGSPNSLIAEHWTNPAYAAAVICNRDDRLSPDQIRMARILSGCDWSEQRIAQHVGARNEAQVKRLLAGNTYTRIV
jgi:hypothetical protein